jgi:hypothetical protein
MARIVNIARAFIVTLVAAALLLVPTAAASADSCHGHDTAHAVIGLGIHTAQATPRESADNPRDDAIDHDSCQCEVSLWLPPMAASGVAALPLTARPFDVPVDRFMAGLTIPPPLGPPRS